MFLDYNWILPENWTLTWRWCTILFPGEIFFRYSLNTEFRKNLAAIYLKLVLVKDKWVSNLPLVLRGGGCWLSLEHNTNTNLDYKSDCWETKTQSGSDFDCNRSHSPGGESLEGHWLTDWLVTAITNPRTILVTQPKYRNYIDR